MADLGAIGRTFPGAAASPMPVRGREFPRASAVAAAWWVTESPTIKLAPTAPTRLWLTPADWFGFFPTISSAAAANIDMRRKLEMQVRQVVDDAEPDGVPMPGAIVSLFYRKSRALVAERRADASGVVKFHSLPYETAGYFAVAFDPDGPPEQNAKVYDKLTPVPMAAGE